MSGVGKGTFSGCLGTLLSCHGFKVSPIKFDGYLNCDAGTLNPYRHGEVFVLDDGTECDLDLGSYERYLNRNLSMDNYLTSGKIFKIIIDKERNGEYLGRDVQFIPHVTGEIKNFVRNLAIKSDADVVLVEVGGTIGDLENSYFIEAMRELRHEEGKDNVCFINVTYIIEPKSLGEFKSKPAQLGIRKLMELGVQPDIIVCRSERPFGDKVKQKLSVFSDVDVNRIYNLWDFGNVYEIPLILRENKVDGAIFDILKIKSKEDSNLDLNFSKLEDFVDKIRKSQSEITIGIIGKYTFVHDSYLSIIKALEHAGPYLGVKVKIKWIESTDLEDKKIKVEDALKDVDGIIVPGGFGKRGVEGKIAAIKYARENKIPFLGLCLGMQLAVVEFARSICNLENAHSTEFNYNTKCPVIDFIPEQINIVKQSKYGGTMRLGAYPAILKEDSQVRKLYGEDKVFERHRHRYEVNPEWVEILGKNGLIFSGKSPDGVLMEFMELKDHPFFIATQSHPELKSRPLNPSPLFVGLVKASIENQTR
ncbi:CTP synthase [Candidatus Micrarchaeota archaeon RBG_16_36_9]|nr:MAG: CTP synthase [Candidatus Micrarchaeota archaeon RBG_16_36_9]